MFGAALSRQIGQLDTGDLSARDDRVGAFHQRRGPLELVGVDGELCAKNDDRETWNGSLESISELSGKRKESMEMSVFLGRNIFGAPT